MNRKSFHNGFITSLPRQNSFKQYSVQDNEYIYLKEQVKNLFTKLSTENTIQAVIQQTGLNSSCLMNQIKRQAIPSNLIDLKKIKEDLSMIEKELNKMKNGSWVEAAKSSSSSEREKRKRLNDYKKQKKENKYKFDEDEKMRIEILKELNYRNKKDKILNTQHLENRTTIIKNKAKKVSESNKRALKIYEKQKQKEKLFYDKAMIFFRKRSVQTQKVQKFRVVNTSLSHERHFEKNIKQKKIFQVSPKKQRKIQIQSMEIKNRKERMHKNQEKMEQANLRRKQLEDRSFQCRIKKAIDLNKKMEQIYEGQDRIIRKKNTVKIKRNQMSLSSKTSDDQERKLIGQMNQKNRRRELYWSTRAEKLREKINHQMNKYELKKQKINKENTIKYDKIYASSIALRKKANEVCIQNQIKRKHNFVNQQGKFQHKILNLRIQPTSLLLKKLVQLQKKNTKQSICF